MALDKKQQRQLDDYKRKLHSLTQRLAGVRREEDSEGQVRQIEDDIRQVENQISDLLETDEGW